MYIDPRNKILRHPDLLLKIRNGERIPPVSVELDLSNRCNLACRNCDFAHVHDGALMELDVALKIVKELACAGVKALTFEGGGEPTTSPHLAEVARAAAARGLDLGLYTNGVRLDVLDCFRWVYVSLDAASREAYEAYKLMDGFDRVCANVRAMAAGETTIGLGFLLNGDNYHEAGDMVALGRELGADYSQLRPTVGLDDYAWVDDALAFIEAIEGHDVYHSRQRFLDLKAHQEGRFERGYTVCRGSEVAPCVDAHGRLYVCGNTRGIDARCLGDLSAESFADVWARRTVQMVGPDCRIACRPHNLNVTLAYVCSTGPHDNFV